MYGGKYLSAPILIASLIATGIAQATDIYQWVDADGVIHFSDTRPDNSEPVSTLHVNASNPAGYDPVEDPYSIANQAKRTNAKWSELEEQREQREKHRREGARHNAQFRPPRYDGWRYSYSPGYYAPVRPVLQPARQLRTISRQVYSMDTLNLTGPRPHSVNSGAHAARVRSSKNFVNSVARPAPRQN